MLVRYWLRLVAHRVGYSSHIKRRSSSWLQNGCLTTVPVLKLGIHPEMERPAILNRSMPSTAGATMSIPAFHKGVRLPHANGSSISR
jgi:hypothetical protein